MRQISKVVLLIAPVLLAASGCATKPAFISQKADTKASSQTADGRTARLLQVAKKYEADGKPDVAYQLYRHIINQDPTCSAARSRMTALAPEQEQSQQIQFASKGKAKLPQPERTASIKKAKTFEPSLASSERSQAERQAALKKIEKSQDKKVDSIELAYSSPTENPASRLMSGNTQAADGFSWAGPKSGNSTEKIAHPINGAALPKMEEGLAQNAPQSNSQEWWGEQAKQNFVKPLAESKTELRDEEVDAPALAASQPAPGEPTVQEISVESPVLSDTTAEEIVTAQSLCEEGATSDLIQVVALLDCPEPEVRIAGLIELGLKGSEAAPATPAVKALLHDDNALVRAHAAGTVRDISGEQAEVIEHLGNLLREEDQGVIQLSCYLLGQMGPAAAPASQELKVIRDRDDSLTSLHAAEALTRIVPNETKSYGKLINALSCNNAECRVFAAVSLGGAYGDGVEIAAAALKEALSSKDASVRASAALSLGGLGQSAEIAVNDLQRLSDNDTPEVRDAALTALACLGK